HAERCSLGALRELTGRAGRPGPVDFALTCPLDGLAVVDDRREWLPVFEHGEAGRSRRAGRDPHGVRAAIGVVPARRHVTDRHAVAPGNAVADDAEAVDAGLERPAAVALNEVDLL